jgi:hypothetical protein
MPATGFCTQAHLNIRQEDPPTESDANVCRVGTGGSPLDVDLHAGLLQQEQAAEALQEPPGRGVAAGRARVATAQRLQRLLSQRGRCHGLCRTCSCCHCHYLSRKEMREVAGAGVTEQASGRKAGGVYHTVRCDC